MKVRGSNVFEDAGLMSLDTDAKNLGHQLSFYQTLSTTFYVLKSFFKLINPI